MDKVSIIIPARNEIYLLETIEDIFKNARGEIEVIAVLDGYMPDRPFIDHLNLSFIHKERSEGMRQAINSAASAATGKYLLKCDAHCMFAEGFDEILKKDCDVDWVVVPRRYGLFPDKWERDDAARDAHYLSYPFHDQTKPPLLRGRTWKERAAARKDILIDDDMTSQGSCWLMHRDYFWKFGGLNFRDYGPFIQEFQEIGNRTWLSGGRVVVNKNTWYAHWYKRTGQGYVLSKRQSREGVQHSYDFWFNNRWKDRIHDFSWLVDKFWPVPTWPENWKELCQKSA